MSTVPADTHSMYSIAKYTFWTAHNCCVSRHTTQFHALRIYPFMNGNRIKWELNAFERFLIVPAWSVIRDCIINDYLFALSRWYFLYYLLPFWCLACEVVSTRSLAAANELTTIRKPTPKPTKLFKILVQRRWLLPSDILHQCAGFQFQNERAFF